MKRKTIKTLTSSQIRMLAVFRKQIGSSFTFPELRKQLKAKSNSQLQRAIKLFQELGILSAEKVGKTYRYRLNLANGTTLSYLALLDQQELQQIPIVLKAVKELTEHMQRDTEFFALLVFGSYAKGTASEKSDLDLAVIAPDEDTQKMLRADASSIERRSLLKLDLQFFTRTEFLEMLRVEEENVGKEIARNNYIYYGADLYYKLLHKVLDGTPRETIFGES